MRNPADANMVWEAPQGEFLGYQLLTDRDVLPQVDALRQTLQNAFLEEGYVLGSITQKTEKKIGEATTWLAFYAKDLMRRVSVLVGFELSVLESGFVNSKLFLFGGRQLHEDGQINESAPYTMSSLGEWPAEHGDLDWMDGYLGNNRCNRALILNQILERKLFDSTTILSYNRIKPLIQLLEP